MNKNTLQKQIEPVVRVFGCLIAVNDLLTELLLFDALKCLNDYLQNTA